MTLIALCILLIALVGYEAVAPIKHFQVPLVSHRYEEFQLPSEQVRIKHSASSFSAITDRPLFIPSRLKLAAGAAELVQDPNRVPDLILLGVIIDATSRLALIRASSASSAMTVAIGDAIGAWTIAKIEADQITLHSDLGDHMVALTPSRVSSEIGRLPITNTR